MSTNQFVNCAERARRAKQTMRETLPAILRSSLRARIGIERASLVTELGRQLDSDPVTEHRIDVRIVCTDTLTAARQLTTAPQPPLPRLKGKGRPNVAVLNMASPLRPGGGVLDGAGSQEEFLCIRTTLLPSLSESFYRLPEVGGVYSPDVLVFRDGTAAANGLAKTDRYFVDVITAAMLRFPVVDPNNPATYAESSDRELAASKMRAVMRMAQARGVEQLVLGAWGCGAYGNPVREVAALWRGVILGKRSQRRPNGERWQGIREVIFAISDWAVANEFGAVFERPLVGTEGPGPPLAGQEPGHFREDESYMDSPEAADGVSNWGGEQRVRWKAREEKATRGET